MATYFITTDSTLSFESASFCFGTATVARETGVQTFDCSSLTNALAYPGTTKYTITANDIPMDSVGGCFTSIRAGAAGTFQCIENTSTSRNVTTSIEVIVQSVSLRSPNKGTPTFSITLVGTGDLDESTAAE